MSLFSQGGDQGYSGMDTRVLVLNLANHAKVTPPPVPMLQKAASGHGGGPCSPVSVGINGFRGRPAGNPGESLVRKDEIAV